MAAHPRLLLMSFGLSGLLTAQSPIDADWMAVRGLAAGTRVQVRRYSGPAVGGRMVAAAEKSVTISAKDGQRVFDRGEIKRLTVASARRRGLYGGLGIATGVILGFLVCPHCANEGRADITSVLVGIGAGIGSLAFLIPSHWTVYKGPKRVAGAAKPPS